MRGMDALLLLNQPQIVGIQQSDAIKEVAQEPGPMSKRGSNLESHDTLWIL